MRANPVWAVDGNGLLRVMWKGDVGLITYDGALADGKPAASLTDGIVSTEFQKAADPEISIGLVGRWKDAKKNYYVARFCRHPRPATEQSHRRPGRDAGDVASTEILSGGRKMAAEPRPLKGND